MIKLITEFGPLIAFFVGYKLGGIIEATLYMLLVSICCVIASYLTKNKISKATLASIVLLVISSSLTLFSGNVIFIKMKPTILYSIFSILLAASNYTKKPILKMALEGALSLSEDRYWHTLNNRFAAFFLLMAVTNELIWRNFSEQIWVNFKVFGALPITLLFLITQAPFLMRHRQV